MLTPRLTSDSQRLERAAQQLGWSVHRATRYQLPASIDDPVVYGELPFCDVMAVELGLGLLDPPDWWLSQLPLKYRSRDVQLYEHMDLKHHDQRSFVKPANDKLFEAGIFEKGWHVPHRHIDPYLPVLVSEVVVFGCELRGYVLDRKLLTAGVYSMWGASEEKEASLYEAGCEWLRELLADTSVPLPSALVIDVGYIPELMTWAVVEANQAYASGVYDGGYMSEKASPGADAREVLRVVERSGGLLSKVSSEDTKWLRPRTRRP